MANECEKSMRGWGPTGYVDPTTERQKYRRSLESWQFIARGNGVGWTPFERAMIAKLLTTKNGRRWLVGYEL